MSLLPLHVAVILILSVNQITPSWIILGSISIKSIARLLMFYYNTQQIDLYKIIYTLVNITINRIVRVGYAQSHVYKNAPTICLTTFTDNYSCYAYIHICDRLIPTCIILCSMEYGINYLSVDCLL